jgi:hypothetical protein
VVSPSARAIGRRSNRPTTMSQRWSRRRPPSKRRNSGDEWIETDPITRNPAPRVRARGASVPSQPTARPSDATRTAGRRRARLRGGSVPPSRTTRHESGVHRTRSRDRGAGSRTAHRGSVGGAGPAVGSGDRRRRRLKRHCASPPPFDRLHRAVGDLYERRPRQGRARSVSQPSRSRITAVCQSRRYRPATSTTSRTARDS